MQMFLTILDKKSKQAQTTLMMLIVGLCLIGSPAVITGQDLDAAVSTIPYPELEGMESPARSKIESMQQALEGLIEKPDTSSAELAEGYGYLGQLFHAYDLLDAAETCYDEAQSRAPDDERWTYFRALVHNSKGDFEAALEDYARASALNSANSAALIKSGDVLIELGRWREAGERFQQARANDAENAAALYGLGRVAANEGDFAVAAELFEQVLELQPEATVVHYPLGQAYRKLGKTEQARTHLGQRGQDEVSYVDPLGVLVSRLAKSTAVEVVLTLAQNSAGFSPEQFLGYALSQLGDIKGAIEELRTAIEIHEQSRVAESDPKVAARFHYVLGGLLVNDRRDPEAVTHFNAAIDLDPTLLDARIKAANAFARAEKYPAAASMYGQVLDVDSRNEAALLKRGAVYMKQGNFEGAAEDLSKLVLLAPESAEAQIRLAVAREELGDTTGAIRGLRRALELDLRSDERASTLTRLGNLFRERGNVAEALANYRAISGGRELFRTLGGSGSSKPQTEVGRGRRVDYERPASGSQEAARVWPQAVPQ
jgi:tetratricopeptide (TPR) repeat protein